MTTKRRAARPSQEVTDKVLEAHRHGDPIEVEYDEITGLLDAILTRAHQVTDESVRKVHEAKKILDAHSSAPGLRRVV